MLQRLLVWLIFVVLVVVWCAVRPNAARMFVGGFFVVMGLGFHLIQVLLNPHAYDGFAANALLGVYRWAFATLVLPQPLVFAVLAAAGEVLLGLMMLGAGRTARLGLIGGSLFLLAITPLTVETLPNAILAVGLAFAATRWFPASLPAILRSRLAPRRPHAPV